MRITNQMVSNNSLRNMQKSMAAVNKTTEQMTTGKKISQASEDPVIAIRALKLRTTVNQLEQYKDKNIPDAESWLDISTTSLDNIVKRIEDIENYCVQGSTDSFNTTDRGAIIDSLKQLQSMIYNEGNSSYAGRYIFSGYKTDRGLTFADTEDTSVYSYDITQHFDAKALETKNVVNKEVDYNKVDDYIADPTAYEQPDPEMVYRLNLGYEGVDDISSKGQNVFNVRAYGPNGNIIDLSNFSLSIKTINDSATYYEVGRGDVNFIEETGELIFGENVYNTLKQAEDIQVTYALNEVEPGELRPEHYYDCVQHVVQPNGGIKDINYTVPEDGQKIYYEVNFSQSIQVNTEGKDIVSDEMANNINDLIYTLKDLEEAELAKSKLEDMLEDVQYSSVDAAVKQINQMLKDVDVEIAAKKENLQKTFSKNITNFQTYMEKISAMQSDVGSRMSKLEMIGIRVDEQYASFKELKSKNEDAETDETIIDFNEAGLVYESALAATSNIMNKTLLDYL